MSPGGGGGRNGRNAISRDLLDVPIVGAVDVAVAESAVADLLHTASDVLTIQAEAVVALEASAKSLGRPGLRALNISTGPYGALFGRWLSASGAEVVDLAVPFSRTVTIEDVENALEAGHFDLVAAVHAEAATGGANPIEEIAAMVAASGALLVVDAVASVGAHRVRPDSWPADVVVIGAQKALAGPAGVSALSVSPRAWEAMQRNPSAPRESILSLLDLRDGWLSAGRTTLLGTPSSLETAALGQALARVADEGLEQVIGRHQSAAAATRAGARALGLQPWIADDRAAAGVATTLAVPAGWSPPALVAAARAAGAQLITAAPGSLAGTTLRVNHTGRAAELRFVRDEIAALSVALDADPAEPLEAAEQAFAAREGQ